MKRPSAARAQGKQRKRCSCCGSFSHRIESCEEPGADQIRRLMAQLKKIEGRPSKHVLRQEKKKRISAQKSQTHAQKAAKQYRGKLAARKASPSEKRLRIGCPKVFIRPKKKTDIIASLGCLAIWCISGLGGNPLEAVHLLNSWNASMNLCRTRKPKIKFPVRSAASMRQWTVICCGKFSVG